jgi:REP element-mobilizing transposase RayT
MKACATWLKEYAEQFNVSIHAKVVMANLVYTLCTPNSPFSMSQMMQPLGRGYVPFFNRRYKRFFPYGKAAFLASLQSLQYGTGIPVIETNKR